MSSERENPTFDALVNETYRRLASEKAPEHLDRAVLEQALANQSSGEKRTVGKPLFARWMKPVAWAATVGLSLAIVLDASKLPSVTDADRAMPEAGIAEPRRIKDEFEGAAVEAKEVIERRARLAASPTREVDDGPLTAPQESADNSALENSSLEKRTPKLKQEAYAAGASGISPVSRTAMPEQSSDAMQAEPQDERLEQPALPAAALAYSRVQEKPESACPESARESANAWLQCIEDLRLTGDKDAADREYVLFVFEFPAEAAALEKN